MTQCPVVCVSKQQSTIATSTIKSEYTALSIALRAVIPLLAVVSSVTNGLKIITNTNKNIQPSERLSTKIIKVL